MKLTAKIPDWIRQEMDSLMGITDPIGVKLCNSSTDYLSRADLISAFEKGEWVRAEANCNYHRCTHWAEFQLTEAQAKWLRGLNETAT